MKTVQETTIEECIDLCNKMLRGERSAIETYSNAIEKFESQPGLNLLSHIRDEHQQSVNDLEEQVRLMGATPDSDSGAWGTFATLVQKAANLFGEESAVKALEEGEKKGLSDYRDALESGHLAPGCRELYTNSLIPRINRHLATLDRVEDQLDA